MSLRILLPALACAGIALSVPASPVARQPIRSRTITWHDVAPVRDALRSRGIAADGFASFVERLRQTNARRVHEGDLDHLIFYLLQSTTFTQLQPIEPALSAKAYVETGSIPVRVTERAQAFLRAIERPRGDARLSYFRDLARIAFQDRHTRATALLREYVRVMKFVYEKEFVAQRSERRHAAVAELYRTRGFSTDTAVEAGFLVSEGLAVLRALDPSLRIRRVLIVGPGLDLAPRTGLLDVRTTQSYQPWAVIDALLSLSLSRVNDLEITCADINPRVVRHLRSVRDHPPTLTFISDIRETEAVSLSEAFRAYFGALGSRIHSGQPAARNAKRESGAAGAPEHPEAWASAGHLSKVIQVRPDVARVLKAEILDVVTQRISGTHFDLIIATNILPYFDDVELLLAMANVASMLPEGGVFLHNEDRPVMEEYGAALALPVAQARSAIVATVRGAPPLFDHIIIHRKDSGGPRSASTGDHDHRVYGGARLGEYLTSR